jgi:hypothetical protein
MNEVKEKLTELIEQAERKNPDCGIFPYILAEELAQNGVTIQKWVSVDERLPEIWKTVLVCDVREDYVDAWEYNGKDLWRGDGIFYGTEDITHWMPIPKPPKEVQ